MSRRVIALLIAILAMAFAFCALAAIRWPSLMLLGGMFLKADIATAISSIEWRRIGIAYGAPYFLAGLCFYASSTMLAQRRHGSVAWYIMGCAAGFPCVFFMKFSPLWWRNPSPVEGAVAGGALAALLLGIAVWDLRKRPTREAEMEAHPSPTPKRIEREAPETDLPPQKPAKPTIHRLVPAAIAMQRAHFAAEGRKMMARRRR